MIGFKLLAAGVAAVTVMTGASAMASTCTDTCNTKFTACDNGGGGTQCLATWHQCKDRCQAPVLQKTSATQTPTPQILTSKSLTTKSTAVNPKPH